MISAGVCVCVCVCVYNVLCLPKSSGLDEGINLLYNFFTSDAAYFGFDGACNEGMKCVRS